MSNKFLLLNLAPWPTLLSLIRHAPQDWIVWGALPGAVKARFAAMGVTIHDEELPRPFHRAKLPGWLCTPWQGIVAPALGHPLPTRWPIVRRIATTGAPIYIARHGQIMRAPEIPSTDAFTWALERNDETAELKHPPSTEFSCVRADLLGDLLLALPALTALAEKGSIRLVIREEWREWMEQLLPAGCKAHGLQLAPWNFPVFESAETSVDLSPPGWNSPLTPALARAIPAKKHLNLAAGNGLSEMIALTLGLNIQWPCRKPGSSAYGVLVPTGSSLERRLPDDYWSYAVRRISQAMGVHTWTVVNPDNPLSSSLLRQIPNAQPLTEWQKPRALIELTRKAAVVVGVSTALTHLAALTGTPALVVEHPTTAPEMYRAPVPFVRYIRPANPWWCDNPSNDDVERAMTEPENTYGFARGEWRDAVDQIIIHPPFASNN